MRARTRLALDASLLTAFVAAYRPAWTGLTVHQWLSLVIVAPLLVHGVVNWDWTVRVARSFFDRLLHMSRLNLVIDSALFLSAVCVMVSGVMVSPMLLSLLGVHAMQPPIWHLVHKWSANTTILCLAVHGVAHWRWLTKTAEQFVGASRDGGVAGARVSAARATAAAAKPAAVRRTSHVGHRATAAAKERATAARAISVVGVTGLVGLTVFAGVSMASPHLSSARGASASVAQSGAMVCPQTGCTASRCHAQYGKSAQEFYGSATVKGGLAKHVAARPKRATGAKIAALQPKVVAQPKPAAKPSSTKLVATAAAPARAAAPKPARVVTRAAPKPKVHLLTCPQTGCTASSCHGAHGVSASKWYKSH